MNKPIKQQSCNFKELKCNLKKSSGGEGAFTILHYSYAGDLSLIDLLFGYLIGDGKIRIQVF